MTIHQFRFTVMFIVEFSIRKLTIWGIMAATWVMEQVILGQEYLVHLLLYNRGLGGLYFESQLENDIPDGLLWIRDELAGFRLTPIPFWVHNRWIAKHEPFTPALDFNIKSTALSRDLRPVRVEWKVTENAILKSVEESGDAIYDYNLKHWLLNDQQIQP